MSPLPEIAHWRLDGSNLSSKARTSFPVHKQICQTFRTGDNDKNCSQKVASLSEQQLIRHASSHYRVRGWLFGDCTASSVADEVRLNHKIRCCSILNTNERGIDRTSINDFVDENLPLCLGYQVHFVLLFLVTQNVDLRAIPARLPTDISTE